jgi:adenylate cyclase
VATRVHSLPGLERKARALGFASVVEDETKVVREYEMVLSHREALYAPLAVQAVARYLGVNRGQVAYLGPSREVRIGDRAYPLGLHNEVLIDFCGPERTFPTYSAVDVVRGAVPKGALAGKLVWVGFSALGSDQVLTPFGPAPGVELQATLTDGHPGARRGGRAPACPPGRLSPRSRLAI